MDGELKRSVVVTGVGGWSDWSVSGAVEFGEEVEVRIRREGGMGSALVVSCFGDVVREVQWVFAGEEGEAEEVWVGFYGARPAEVGESLQVRVHSWEVVTC